MRAQPPVALLARSARYLTTSSFQSEAAPALVQKSSGPLSWLFGGSRISVPLSEPVDVDVYSSPVPVKPPQLQVTTTDKGLRVASVDLPGPNTTLAVFVEAGSADEPKGCTGVSKYLEYLAFSATKNRTTFRLTRELEKYGALARCKASRECTTFAVNTVKVGVPEVAEVLVDAVMNPRFNSWEVKDVRGKVQEDMAEALSDPFTVVTEILHRAAFSGGLGQPLLVDPSQVASLDVDKILEFVTSNFTPGRVLLGAAGVDHSQLVNLVNPMAAALSSSTGSSPAASSQYLGGTVQVLGNTPLSYVGLAFESKGGLGDVKSAATSAVIRSLLDDNFIPLPYRARSLSPVLKVMKPFDRLYKTTGLLGVLAASEPTNSSQALDVLSQKFEAIAKGVTEQQLAQAKAIVAGTYKEATSSTSGVVEDIGLQLLSRSKYDPTSYLQAVSSLGVKDVTSHLTATLKTPPTIVTYGGLVDLPRVDHVIKRFKA